MYRGFVLLHRSLLPESTHDALGLPVYVHHFCSFGSKCSSSRCSNVLSASTPVNNFHIIIKCGIGLKLDIAAPCSLLSLLVHFILWSSKLTQNSVASIHSAAVQFFLSLRWESSANILAGHLGLEISNLAFFPIASQLINPLSIHC